ncbi:MAG: protein translocase subunit SecD [Actinomycetota bacterium]|nr:protein translocase subunit SecD [Actinomycetota bacterium]
MQRRLVVPLLATVLTAVGALVAVVVTETSPQLGLDLQGGAAVVLRPEREVPSAVLDQSIRIIRSRVDALGVAEPEISSQGDNIIVQLPGVKDSARALDVVGQTAELRFRPVLAPNAPAGPEGEAKITPREEDKPEAQVILPGTKDEQNARYVLGPSELTGRAVKDAKAEVDPGTGEWKVAFTLTDEGSKEFDALAARNLNKQVAIVLDGVVQSAPTIQQAKFEGSGEITGNFSEREAKDLALVLRFGALPVELKPETVQTVSASLGRDSLKAGVGAGLAGLALVLVYMILYYRALGVVVVLGLGVSGMLMWSIVSFLGQTQGLSLTLAGAVGIIVSVGVTVDSYVVYFERLKDEIRSGKTIRSSVDRGFSRAYRTILVADFASLIGAGLLYWLAVGSVRGFAFFLGLSTLLDMVIAYCFTRPMVVLLGRNRLFTEARWLGVARGLAAAPAGGA